MSGLFGFGNTPPQRGMGGGVQRSPYPGQPAPGVQMMGPGPGYGEPYGSPFGQGPMQANTPNPEQPQIVVVPGGGGRYLPAYYDGQQILYRFPWDLTGELVIAPGGSFLAFPPAVFQNNTDKPFEIHDIQESACLLANDLPTTEPAPGIDHWWRIMMKIVTVQEDMLSQEGRAAAIFDPEHKSWPMYMPYTFAKTEGARIQIANDQAAQGDDLRVSLGFRGYLLILGPATQR